MATQNCINNSSFPVAATAVTIDPGSSGDSYVQLAINTTDKFILGVDDTDDSFAISSGSALGTTNRLNITADGFVSVPAQPLIKVTPSGNLDNVTGDGTTYTIVYGTELIDIAGNFSSTTFTAPIAGTYFFYAGCATQFEGASTTVLIEFNLNSGTTYPVHLSSGSSTGFTSPGSRMTGSVFLSMAVSDTITFQVTGSGGTKTMRVIGTGTETTSTYLYGFLVS